MEMTVVFEFGGCVDINTGQRSERKALQEAGKVLKQAEGGLIDGKWRLNTTSAENVAFSSGIMTLEIEGEISVTVDADTQANAQQKAWNIIMSSNQKDIAGFGVFEWHDGSLKEVIMNQPKPRMK